MLTCTRFTRVPLAIAALLGAACAPTRSVPAQTGPAIQTQTVGKYSVDFRLPREGLFAEQETDVEFHVADTSQVDPVQGAAPIVNAKVTARVTMPRMSEMPAQSPTTHSEGVPGDYGVVLYFPHGGEYRLDLTIAPPLGSAFSVEYKLSVGDATAAAGKKLTPRPYTLEVVSDPSTPVAGDPALLGILVRGRSTGQIVREFDTVHTKQIHFMIVSADLQHFAHEHPVAGDDGRFTLKYTFPAAGEYHLFADVAPRGAGSQILMQAIRVSGPMPATAAGPKFSPSMADAVGGVNVALAADPATFPVGHTLDIVFTLKDAVTGMPVTNLEPYLGAMAHLMLIHRDGTTFVHSHPDETEAANGHSGAINFLARFPKPGFYRGWLQFQRNGKVETAVFTWEVTGDKRKAK